MSKITRGVMFIFRAAAVDRGGAPQCGQAAAWSDTSFLHSRQLSNANLYLQSS